MICDNVHIQLFVGKPSNVEENPGLTIIDTIDPQPLCLLTTNKGNEALLGESAGKQCVALLHDSLQIHDINLQSNYTLNTFIGNNQHDSTRYCVQ